MTASGVVLPRWDDAGSIKFATNNGWGIGRYIKDLETLGGQDAVYDPATGQLRALGLVSGYVGYERQWRSWLQLEVDLLNRRRGGQLGLGHTRTICGR